MMLVAGCASEVSGTAAPHTPTQAAVGNTAAPESSATDGTTSPDDVSIADPAECVVGDEPAPVDCDQPHTVEITSAGTFGGAIADAPPDRETVFEAVFPSCRAEAASYLGSDEFDLTTLSAWLLWAGEEAWERGERWYRCGVAELDGEGRPKERTGSLRNSLRRDGIHTFRLCTAAPPSEEVPTPTSCAKPHRGEAIATKAMGEPDEPLPNEKRFNVAAKAECAKALVEYIGADRDDVDVSWRWPDKLSWKRGFTNFTCYAEPEHPVTAPLRGIGGDPLPK